MSSAYRNWRAGVKAGVLCGDAVPSAYLVCILPWHVDERHLYGSPEIWFPGGTDSDDWTAYDLRNDAGRRA